jgi:hypothetical protein
VELLHDGVRGAELEKWEQSSPKHPLNQEIKNKENKNGEQLLSRLVLFSSKTS